MNALNVYGRFFDTGIKELLASLHELVPEKNKLTYRDRLLDDEIDYADNRMEVHVSVGISPKGNPKNRYIMSGLFRGTMAEAVHFFTGWQEYFNSKNIKCDFEITEEDENGNEIATREIK